MKRDMNLIREMLLYFERDCEEPRPNATPEEFEEHLIMLIEAGYVAGRLERGSHGCRRHAWSDDGRVIERCEGGFEIFPVTWSGHEFLAASRDDALWKSALKAVGKASMPVIMAFLQDQLLRAAGVRR